MKYTKKNPSLILDRYIHSKKKPRDYFSIYRHFSAFLASEYGINEVDEWKQVNSNMAFHYTSYCQNKYASNTVEKYITVVRCFFKVLIHTCFFCSNPFELVRVKGERKRVRYYERVGDPEKVIRFVSRQDEHRGIRDAALLAVLFGRGLRISEALELKVADYTEFGLIVRSSKENKASAKQVPEWVRMYIEEWFTVRGSENGFLFCSIKGPKNRKYRNTKLNERTVNKRLGHYCERLGIKRFTSHYCRATAITRALETGNSLEQVRDWVGHSTTKTTESYDRRIHELFTIEY